MNLKTYGKIPIFSLFACLCLLMFAGQNALAQCGTYFKTNYRAVDKIRYANNGFFQLNDWNGDGRLDFWNFQPNAANTAQNILIYPGKAGGYWDWDNPFVYTTSLPTSAGFTNNRVVVMDFNSDGKTDLLFQNRIHRNEGSGTLTALAPITNFEVGAVEELGFYDINGDGRLDHLNRINSPTGGNSLSYNLGNADGTLGQTVVVYTGIDLQFSNKKIFADFNGDGKIDVAFSSGSNYRVLLNSGNGVFAAGNSVQPVEGVVNFVEAKDFNKDGKADILAVGGTPKKLVIFYGQANGTFTETAQTINTSLGGQPRVAELSGDDNPDVIEINSTINMSSYTVHINNGSGGFSIASYSRSIVSANSNGSVGDLIFSDFSGDGKADVYDASHGTYNVFGEEVVLVRENGCQPFGETRKMNFDGDAVGEIATWNPNTGVWYSRNGSNRFDSLKTFKWGLGSLGDVPAPGDFDGDGRTDYTVFRSNTGEWYSFLSATSSWLGIKFGAAGDIAVPSDYDGGGKTDIAVYRPSEGNWYIWYSETQSFGALHFGASGDKPVASDYDGDGRTDVAVFRPSEGNWYYFKSSDSRLGVFKWGIASDIPQPADYDGDGKSDLTVFRDGTWYVYRSSKNAAAYLFGGAATDVQMPFYYGDLARPIFYHLPNRTFYNASPVTYLSEFSDPAGVPVRFGLPNN